MIFWDTSALLRCYEGDQASHARARNLLLRERGHCSSALLRLEAVSGIRRRFGRDRAKVASLLRTVNAHIDHFDLQAIDEAVLEKGIPLVERHGLRAGDAIHLASALLLARDLGRRHIRFASVDREQTLAASAEGLKVIKLE
jgi:predicted nucleic acid-binding protein